MQRIHGTELGNLPKEVRSKRPVGKAEFRLVRMSVKEGSDWDLTGRTHSVDVTHVENVA